jgi:hypothetical protein
LLGCIAEAIHTEISNTFPSFSHHDKHRRRNEQKRRWISVTAFVPRLSRRPGRRWRCASQRHRRGSRQRRRRCRPGRKRCRSMQREHSRRHADYCNIIEALWLVNGGHGAPLNISRHAGPGMHASMRARCGEAAVAACLRPASARHHKPAAIGSPWSRLEQPMPAVWPPTATQ